MHYAHTLKGRPREEWHPLLTHLQGVAALAADFARPFGGEQCAHLAGFVHDVGKFPPAFQDYLVQSHAGTIRAKGGDHAILGAVLLRAAGFFPPRYALLANLLAYVVAGHHAGLPDGGPLVGSRASLQSRLAAREAAPDVDCWREHLTLPDMEADALMPAWLKATAAQGQGFALAFFARMVFSCVVDADYLHTEAFCAPEIARSRAGHPDLLSLAPLLDQHFAALREKQQAASQAGNSQIFAWRNKIAAHCRDAGQAGQGFFALTVPTGGGKTLASLAFALRHAQQHGLRRVIYVAPFTSIIEQNARVYRDIFGDKAVLEHHCNYSPPAERGADGTDGDTTHDALSATRTRLAAQNWTPPIIATTAVQFFESLFASKPSRCRKLHNMVKSLVILDEAQSLPLPLLKPTLEALRELTRGYGVSIVLCTATQPALDAESLPAMGFAPGEIREIVPLEQQEALFSAFCRTRLRFTGKQSNEDIAALLRTRPQALCIVNTRDAARRLYECLDCPPEEKFHLSARMYPQHRRSVLKVIKARLRKGKPCRVVSTQLIEAGVDIDFPLVVRALAGLDAIAQAAGRCNREGCMPHPGEVLVYLPTEGLPKAPFFFRRAAIAQGVAEKYADVLHPDAQKEFFRQLYTLEDLDAKKIMQDFVVNSVVNANLIDYKFRNISERYSLIDDSLVPVVVECKSALSLVDIVENGFPCPDVYKKLQSYTVQIYPWELQELERRGVVRLVRGVLHVLGGGTGYRRDTGLAVDAPHARHPGDNIF